MILQALRLLAQREGLMDAPDFQRGDVPWIVRVSKDGKLLAIEDTRYEVPLEGKKKSIKRAKQVSVPRRRGRSGTKAPPDFLVDNAKYVFGLPTKDTRFPPKEGKEKSGWFREMITKCAQETNDEGVQAVATFLSDVATGRSGVTLPDDCRSNDLFAFAFGTDDEFVHERPKVKDFWIRLRSAKSKPGQSGKLRCLVTGDAITEPGLFPKIKGVPGARPAQIGLVCFDDRSFESYGWDHNENAPISRDAAEASATALNRLLDSDHLPRRNLALSSNTVVCYWAGDPSGDEFTSAFASFWEPDPAEVRELYRTIWRGKEPHIEDPSVFYALTLSGTQGRAIVRGWFESTVKEVARNLALHFHDLNIVRNSDSDLPIQLARLLESLAPQGDRKKIPPHLAAQIVESALRGTPYPFSILPRAVERARAEIGGENAEEKLERFRTRQRSEARAALIKAVLNRRKRFFPQQTQYEEVQPEMDPSNSSEGYTLGRLMAVLERIQQEAIGDVNASVIDRYFSGASANPKTVFVRLLKNARHHVSKAKNNDKSRGLAILLDRLVDDLAGRFDPKNNGFPAYLTLDQQGLYVLGYHHMRRWLQSSEYRTEWQMSHPDAPKPYLWPRRASKEDTTSLQDKENSENGTD